MRALMGALSLLAAISAARADDAYTLPAVGAQLTFRIISTSKIGDHTTTTTGQIYTYTITAVNGSDIEGTIRPLAMISSCPQGSDPREDCIKIAKMAGAKRDGDLLTVPVPDAIAGALSKLSSYKGHYFMVEERIFAVPGPKDSADPNDVEFGDEPLFVLTNQLNCDYRPLAGFFPIGKTPLLSLDCHNVFSRTRSRIAPMNDRTQDEPMAVQLSPLGADKLSLPSGDWDVQKVAIKYVPTDPSHPTAEGESDVATKLGITVKSHSMVSNKATNLTVESTSEMIAYKP